MLDISQSELLVELSVEQQQFLSGGIQQTLFPEFGGLWTSPKTIERPCDSANESLDFDALCKEQSSKELLAVSTSSELVPTNGSCISKTTYQCKFSIL
ncbi:hypothetical protein [Nodularia sphaerocarpa]|uniref:hypothetical protein n=1 Tax=Nodularia sphaerocarpa TaxID=137816 RepID=UPI0023300E5F|nr:hypothetical protein [Nodularia sphaerocarpa]MDB9372351.1 hypothetical protein [Nodularia sphaerocarpa CS-585]MDB9377967.1 hypothetical protein [Nodularia sphaerocarpa CS-585A2]